MKLNLQLNQLTDTEKLAENIALFAEPNMIVLLNGNLGTGKTQLTKFIGNKLGIKTLITSPTFVISNQYETAKKWKLIHIDAYRLNNIVDFNEYWELMKNNFTIIEWAQNLNLNFKNLKTLSINITLNNNHRIIQLYTNNWTANAEEDLKTRLSKQLKIFA